MLNWKDRPEVERHPQVVSGDWVSKLTRLPVEALFENLKDGARVDDFIAWFPGVTRHQIQAVLHDPNDWLCRAAELFLGGISGNRVS